MSDLFYIGLFILIIVILVGVVIGLYLASHATSVNDDEEEYDRDSAYFDEKWKQNGPRS